MRYLSKGYTCGLCGQRHMVKAGSFHSLLSWSLWDAVFSSVNTVYSTGVLWRWEATTHLNIQHRVSIESVFNNCGSHYYLQYMTVWLLESELPKGGIDINGCNFSNFCDKSNSCSISITLSSSFLALSRNISLLHLKKCLHFWINIHAVRRSEGNVDKHNEGEEERGKKRQQLDMRKLWNCCKKT